MLVFDIQTMGQVEMAPLFQGPAASHDAGCRVLAPKPGLRGSHPDLRPHPVTMTAPPVAPRGPRHDLESSGGDSAVVSPVCELPHV